MFDQLLKKRRQPPKGPGKNEGDEEKVEAPEVDETLANVDAALKAAEAEKRREIEEKEYRERQRLLERERSRGGGGCGCGGGSW
jgi:hypothetical protein